MKTMIINKNGIKMQQYGQLRNTLTDSDQQCVNSACERSTAHS